MMYEIKNVKHLKGRTQEAYRAKLHIDNRCVGVVYDALNDRLIIHDWFKLTQDEFDYIREELIFYFRDIARARFTVENLKNAGCTQTNGARKHYFYAGYPEMATEIAVFTDAASRNKWVAESEKYHENRVPVQTSSVKMFANIADDADIALLVEHCLQPALSGECIGWIVL